MKIFSLLASFYSAHFIRFIMKKMKYILTILVFFGFAIISLKAQNMADLYAKVDLTTVIVEVIATETAGNGDMNEKVSTGSLGSGVLVNKNGKIITAAHVVNNAEAIRIVFKDGQKLPAKIVALSRGADVALLQCDGVIHHPIVARMGNSDNVRIGDKVMVIGSPMGLDHSLSVGYISRRDRDGNSHNGLRRMEFFQMDAAINTGNSGGTMFNMKGELIGIVSFILTWSGGFEGIGFAATINIVKKLLFEKPNVWLGVDVYYLQGHLAFALNVPQEGGILIENITKDSPAYFMGLHGGYIKAEIDKNPVIHGVDIILSVDGKKFSIPKKMFTNPWIT